MSGPFEGLTTSSSLESRPSRDRVRRWQILSRIRERTTGETEPLLPHSTDTTQGAEGTPYWKSCYAGFEKCFPCLRDASPSPTRDAPEGVISAEPPRTSPMLLPQSSSERPSPQDSPQPLSIAPLRSPKSGPPQELSKHGSEGSSSSDTPLPQATSQENPEEHPGQSDRPFQTGSKRIKPYINIVDTAKKSIRIEQKCDLLIKSTPEVEKYPGYKDFKENLEHFSNVRSEAESAQPWQSAQDLRSQYIKLSICFENFSREINTYKKIKEALENGDTTQLLYHIKSHVQCQKQELLQTEEHQYLKNLIELCKAFKDTFSETQLKYSRELLIDHQFQVIESLYKVYMELSNSYEKLTAHTQKLRSESRPTLDELKERFSLSLCLSTDMKNKFEKTSEECWTFLYTYFKSDIIKQHPDIQTPEKYRIALKKKAVDLVKNTNIWTRHRPEALQQILESGRIKSQFETNTSSASLDLERRAKAEEYLFNYPKDLNPALRPIYGYATDDHDGKTKCVDLYGMIAIRLKNSVKQRTTITLADSLRSTDLNERIVYVRPEPYTNPNEGIFHTFPSKQLEELIEEFKDDHHETQQFNQQVNPLNYSSINDNPTFAETHFHGGVGVHDIAEIVFINPEEPPSEEIVKQLEECAKKYNFTWRVAAT